MNVDCVMNQKLDQQVAERLLMATVWQCWSVDKYESFLCAVRLESNTIPNYQGYFQATESKQLQLVCVDFTLCYSY